MNDNTPRDLVPFQQHGSSSLISRAFVSVFPYFSKERQIQRQRTRDKKFVERCFRLCAFSGLRTTQQARGFLNRPRALYGLEGDKHYDDACRGDDRRDNNGRPGKIMATEPDHIKALVHEVFKEHVLDPAGGTISSKVADEWLDRAVDFGSESLFDAALSAGASIHRQEPFDMLKSDPDLYKLVDIIIDDLTGEERDDILNACIERGDIDRTQHLIAQGFQASGIHLETAQEHDRRDIVALLESERESEFNRAVVAEEKGELDLIVQPRGSTQHLRTHDCDIFGHREDIATFVKAQKRVFDLTARFNTWSRPMPEDTRRSVRQVIQQAQEDLSGKLIIKYDGQIIEGHLPFVRATFNAESERTEYRFILPGKVEGTDITEARTFKQALADLAKDPLATEIDALESGTSPEGGRVLALRTLS